MMQDSLRRFSDESMYEIWQWLKDELEEVEAGRIIVFDVLSPDMAHNRYAGEKICVADVTYIYRGYKAWTDLAELLWCRMLTPVMLDDHRVQIRFEKLYTEDSFHQSELKDKREKYGTESRFFAIHKNEEPAFLAAYAQALQRVDIKRRQRVLNLGINRGDEFELIRKMTGDAYPALSLVGIDHSESAIAYAEKRFDEGNAVFYRHDINDLDALQLGRFDLLLSIGTLQSPGIEFKPLFMHLVQNYLTDGGTVILGFPNCRWMGGEMIYGAKAPNYAFSEQSLLYKDVHFCKKYLQQKRYRVTLTGKPYLFLTATPIRK